MDKKQIRAAKIFLSTPSARRATPAERQTSSYEEFLSTPSARRATEDESSTLVKFSISIHALRKEGDCFSWSWCTRT